MSRKTHTNYNGKKEFKDSSSFDYVNEILEYKNLPMKIKFKFLDLRKINKSDILDKNIFLIKMINYKFLEDNKAKLIDIYRNERFMINKNQEGALMIDYRINEKVDVLLDCFKYV